VEPAFAARRTQAFKNLHQIASAMLNYHDVQKAFPPAYRADNNGTPLLSWRVLILPYLGQGPLYREFHLAEPWDSEHNKKLVERMPAVYRSSGSKTAPAMTNCLTVRGPNTVFPGKDGVSLEQITDGTSWTILVVEASDEKAVVWSKPDDIEYDETRDELPGLVGLQPKSFLAAFCDGSLRELASDVDSKGFKKLFLRNDGPLEGPLSTLPLGGRPLDATTRPGGQGPSPGAQHDSDAGAQRSELPTRPMAELTTGSPPPGSVTQGNAVRRHTERPPQGQARLQALLNTDADNPEPGAPIEEEKLQRLAWGPPAPNGLRAACYFEPTKEAYADGEEVVRRLVFHNSGKEPVLFTHGSASESGHDGWVVVEEPIPVPVERQFGLGGGWSVTYRLAPGHAIEDWPPRRVRLGASAKAGQGVHAAIQAKPGTTCRARWSIRVLETMRSENGKRVPATSVWHGTLTTGEVRFRIVEKDADIRANGVLKPLEPRQVNAERRPEDWRVEVSIPKEDARRLRRPANARGELDVDILIASYPTREFRGKLAIPAEAAVNNKDETAVLQVRIHPIDGDIPGDLCVPSDLLLAGASVRMRIRANN
jgi:hypothetical protein